MSTDELGTKGDSLSVAHNILVVEDDADTAASLKDLLESQGFHVSLAKDGGQAHSVFVLHKPDFVLLDLILPSESGFEVCEHLKRTDETVPVLVLTAIDMEDSRNLAERVGADGYVTKPYDPDHLLQEIRTIAERNWAKWHSEQSGSKRRIRFSCRCGKRFKVSRVHRGRTLTCSACGETLVIPHHE